MTVARKRVGHVMRKGVRESRFATRKRRNSHRNAKDEHECVKRIATRTACLKGKTAAGKSWRGGLAVRRSYESKIDRNYCPWWLPVRRMAGF